MNWMRKAVVTAAVALLSVGVQPDLWALCDPPIPAPLGNLFDGAVNTVTGLDLSDPSADFAYFFVGRPDINEAGLGDPTVFRRDIIQDLGGGETVVFADMGLDGRTLGCPLSIDPTGATARVIALFTSRAGTTAVSVVGLGGTWGFDDVNITGAPPSAAVPGAVVLTPSTMDVRVTGAQRNADRTTTVNLTFSAPRAWSDSPTFQLPVGGYDVFRLVVPPDSTPTSEATPEMLPDADGNRTDLMAAVILGDTPGMETRLQVRAMMLDGGGRAAWSAASVPIVTDSTLALTDDPRSKARGRGKGLQKSFPGQD